MSRWRAKGMAILHCRCQESTALLSVLNSRESSLVARVTALGSAGVYRSGR